MRVIAGKFRSRPLQSLRGMDLRPTADRLRETLFNVLSAGNPDTFVGSVWLDLFAGTGAVGIEALSRGAARVLFVESSSSAAGLIERNLKSLGVAGGVEVLKGDASRALGVLEARETAFDFIFLDPPYRMENIYVQTLQALSQSATLLKPNSVIIAEHDKRSDPGDSFGPLQRFRILKQGDAALSFYRIAQ
ncbi:MAG TPA: 16S rRNA (guanine(966)-N(2))-methyltransferase RsmD [Terriglobales bacterium]|jgi:16S rRNA (guanine(966)-N(2))-methyltransferase RsmD|nr:16S rRNA (guanine(966)-N(2))-methyltransferase RsmD [Terriglobales bacterium]